MGLEDDGGAAVTVLHSDGIGERHIAEARLAILRARIFSIGGRSCAALAGTPAALNRRTRSPANSWIGTAGAIPCLPAAERTVTCPGISVMVDDRRFGAARIDTAKLQGEHRADGLPPRCGHPDDKRPVCSLGDLEQHLAQLEADRSTLRAGLHANAGVRVPGQARPVLGRRRLQLPTLRAEDPPVFPENEPQPAERQRQGDSQ